MKKFALAGIAAVVALAPIVAEARATVRVYRGTRASHEYKRQRAQKQAPAAQPAAPAAQAPAPAGVPSTTTGQ